MPRYTDLDAVLAHVWEEVEAAAADPGHVYRTPAFGTVREGAPEVRTVVLRAADAADRELLFHTDRRSKKVAALRETDRVAWHGWDSASREQIRLYGTGTVHLDDDVALDLWASQSPDALALYAKPPAPGRALDAPGDGLRPSVTGDSITEADVAEGRQYFAAVRTIIDRIDWLHLHPEGHSRAQFAYRPAEEAFEGRWVVP